MASLPGAVLKRRSAARLRSPSTVRNAAGHGMTRSLTDEYALDVPPQIQVGGCAGASRVAHQHRSSVKILVAPRA